MAKYSAYFDESGHPDDKQFLVVAGCIATVDQWLHFEREWKEVLRPFNTDLFHMAVFQRRAPPFDSLNDQAAKDLLMRLVGIICRRIEKSFTQVIPLTEYRVINKKYIFAECYGHPYPAIARSCMGRVAEWTQRQSVADEEVRYFFENGAKHKGQLEWIAERDHLPIPIFLEKNQAIPLQAADLIAWHSIAFLLRTTNADNIAALDRLSQRFDTDKDWGLTDLRDPDRMPALLKIPLRDPQFKYKYKIIRKDGRRIASVQYWHKTLPEPKLERKTLALEQPPRLTGVELKRAIIEYEASRRSD
jgi:Protein of unknown function (DUF3800)